MATVKFSNEVIRLWQACFSQRLGSIQVSGDSATQKAFHRMWRTWASLTNGDDWLEARQKKRDLKTDRARGTKSVGENVTLMERGKGKRKAIENFEDEEDENGDGSGSGLGNKLGFKLKEPSPYLIAYLGHLAQLAKSWQLAISMHLRLQENLSRLDKAGFLELNLALNYLHRAMQRQCDNRHHMVAQGFAFLSIYRRKRLANGEHARKEVEYNFGRAFHQLGESVP
jgi:general transcription factor 3C polypeptide 3 (transcription factor C subunit 4)